MPNTKRGRVPRLETNPLICQFVVTGDLWQSEFERCWAGGGAELRQQWAEQGSEKEETDLVCLVL